MPEIPAEMRSWAAKIWSEMMAEVPWVDLSQSHRVSHKRPSLWFERQVLVSQHFFNLALREAWSRGCYCTLLSSDGFCMAAVPLDSSWLVFNSKYKGERMLFGESFKPFAPMGRTCFSACWFPRFLRVVFEAFRNSWMISAINSKLLSLKSFNIYLSTVLSKRCFTSFLKA